MDDVEKLMWQIMEKIQSFSKGTLDTSREPCPDRILDDIGGAFGMGAVGGSTFHFLKGIYNSPKGEHFIGCSQAVRMNAPELVVASRCGATSSPPSTAPWSISATKKILGTHSSPTSPPVDSSRYVKVWGAASRSVMFGGVLLTLIEGACIMLNKVLSAQQNMPVIMEEPTPVGSGGLARFQLPNQAYESETFVGLSSGVETKVLETKAQSHIPCH